MVRGPACGVAVDTPPRGMVVDVVYDALDGFAAGAACDWWALRGGEVDWWFLESGICASSIRLTKRMEEGRRGEEVVLTHANQLLANRGPWNYVQCWVMRDQDLRAHRVEIRRKGRVWRGR